MMLRFLFSLLALLPLTVLATTDQTCLDDCIRQGHRQLQCLNYCSHSSDDLPGKGRQKPQTSPARARQVNGLPETDMLAELMSQADAACKAGNRQACLNLRQMKAGK